MTNNMDNIADNINSEPILHTTTDDNINLNMKIEGNINDVDIKAETLNLLRTIIERIEHDEFDKESLSEIFQCNETYQNNSSKFEDPTLWKYLTAGYWLYYVNSMTC